MSNRKLTLIASLVIALTLTLVGGALDVKTQDDTALTITGMVENEMAWTEVDMLTMDAIEVVTTNKDGEEVTSIGIALNALLEQAGVQDDASLVAFTADDGYVASVSLNDVEDCDECIVAFRDEGGFSMVMPGFSGKAQVKGVVAITVQQPALEITGMVENEMAWTGEQVRAMDTMETVYTNKDGEDETYTGVAINALLEAAGVSENAVAITFIADDGYEASVTPAELLECADCIVAFRDDGRFSTVLPGFAGSVQVKGVVEIKVQKPALTITGMVENEMAWTEEEVYAMDAMDSIYTNKDGEDEPYTGVSLNALLDMAGVQADATEIMFIAIDGYEAGLTVEEIQGCEDCIMAFRDSGGFRVVLPGFASNFQVKSVIEIHVQ